VVRKRWNGYLHDRHRDEVRRDKRRNGYPILVKGCLEQMLMQGVFLRDLLPDMPDDFHELL
jgi:hypothetical protein